MCVPDFYENGLCVCRGEGGVGDILHDVAD